MQIETVKTSFFSMDYFMFGHGEKTLVVLPGLSVQSVMGLAEAVAEAYQLLADSFTIYVFDRRKELPPAYSVHEMAQDTAKAFRVLGLDRMSVFGASQGGMIAMVLAIEHPDLVQKLVLCSTSARLEETQYQTVEKWVQLAKAGDARALYLAFGEALYPHDVFEQSRDFLVQAAETVTDQDLTRFIIMAEGVKGFDIVDDLEKIACPVFLAGSNDDQVLGADASGQIAERLSGRRDFAIHMYDGYGHAVYDTTPDFKERMLGFLTQK